MFKNYFLVLGVLLLPFLANSQTACDDCAGQINKTLSVTGDNPPSGYTVSYSWDSGITSTTNSATVTAAGVYTLTVTWADGSGACPDIVETHTFTVTENPLPTCTASNTGPYCEGEDIQLNGSASSGTAGYTYSWAGPNSYTSTDQNPLISSSTVAMAGTYSLTVTDSKGCVSVACTTDVIISTPPNMVLSGTCTDN